MAAFPCRCVVCKRSARRRRATFQSEVAAVGHIAWASKLAREKREADRAERKRIVMETVERTASAEFARWKADRR